MKKLDHTRLAEGEATGHYHEATGDRCKLYETADRRLLSAPNGSKVTHQEHGVVALPPGKYEILVVKEFDHAEEEARNVVD